MWVAMQTDDFDQLVLINQGAPTLAGYGFNKKKLGMLEMFMQ